MTQTQTDLPPFGTKEYYQIIGRRGGQKKGKKGFALRPDLASELAKRPRKKKQLTEQEG